MKDPDPTIELPTEVRRPGPLPHPQPIKEDPIFAAAPRARGERWGGGYDASNKRVGLIAAVVLVAIGAGVAYYFMNREKTPVEPKPAAPVLPVPKAEEAPAILNPVPQPEAAAPLPSLQDSDKPARDELGAIIGRDATKQFLVPESIVRHAVVTIDNLTRKKVAVQQRPVKATEGEFKVVEKGDVITLSPENYARYAPFIRLVKSADVGQLSTLYFRYYPLFQSAYEDLGYP